MKKFCTFLIFMFYSTIALSAQTGQETMNILNNVLNMLIAGTLGEFGVIREERLSLIEGLQSTLNISNSSGRGGFSSRISFWGSLNNVRYIHNLFIDVLTQRRASFVSRSDSGETRLYMLGNYLISTSMDNNSGIFGISVLRY